MASRNGRFLPEDERDSLIRELKYMGELKKGKTPKEILDKAASLSGNGCTNGHHPAAAAADVSFGTGCLSCGEDDDHANLLLCETCNAEYHTYCLSPPLRAVPAGDWYCAECKIPAFEDDGLDRLVTALTPEFTARFGEICWAQGGVGFGWWPAFIYDPRLTVGSARQLARKHLGKRHLAYFFECHDAPFACLVDSKMAKWEDGLLEDYHLGKTAKASGRARMRLFQQALQAATVELGKPVELRMEFNHTDQPQILPSPKFRKPKRRSITQNNKKPESGSKRRNIRGFPLLSSAVSVDSTQNQIPTRRNLSRAIEALAVASTESATDSPEDGELCCKLLKKSPQAFNDTLSSVGFIKLPSRKNSTFEDARTLVETELVPDCLPAEKEWRFFIPTLGPMSRKQESTLGPLYKFLRLTTCDPNLGDGTLMHPLKLVILDLESSST